MVVFSMILYKFLFKREDKNIFFLLLTELIFGSFNYVDVGTLFEPNFEKLNEIKPDVIFISARQSKVYEELNKIAPTIQLNTETRD